VSEGNQKVIGILCGQERAFPNRFITDINEKYGSQGVRAEYCVISPPEVGQLCKYDVIVDRISHEVPYYRTYLKHAALQGVLIANNPMSWTSQDDKFFAYRLANMAGVVTPRTVLLPQKEYMEGVEPKTLHNMTHPVEWERLLEYVGVPAIVKPNSGGGGKHVYKVESVRQLLEGFARTGQMNMILQEFIDFDKFVRCVCIGRDQILTLRYDPKHPNFFKRYHVDSDYLQGELRTRVTRDSIALNKILAYDMNSVEFAIKDDIPYAIDFTNPAPDMDRASVQPANFEIIVEWMEKFMVKVALEGRKTADELPYEERLKELKAK